MDLVGETPEMGSRKEMDKEREAYEKV